MTGIDVHPVAVHLARAAWVLAARPALQRAAEAGYSDTVSVPVYLGDALQLRFQAGDLFAAHEARVEVEDEQNTSLTFPVSLVERADDFDPLMGDIADAIETGGDPLLALDDHGITDAGERRTLERTIAAMQRLHAEGRNHIWAYYTRNLVRPVALSRSKVDAIVGNPPWLIYRNTASTLRTELERQSKDLYGIWAGGRHANQAGHIQPVLRPLHRPVPEGRRPDRHGHAPQRLQTGQYSKWRTGNPIEAAGPGQESQQRASPCRWTSAARLPGTWSGLEPNNFFPVPASVVFARRTGSTDEGSGSAPGRAGGTLAGQGRRARCPARAGSHHRHLGQECLSLRRPRPAKGRQSFHAAFSL